jgi:hypothetical protein
VLFGVVKHELLATSERNTSDCVWHTTCGPDVHGAARPILATMTTSSCSGGATGSAATGSMAGFKVYGSLFKVDARYQFLNALGKGSYGIVW